ncbi:GNAT family N-acetyltransferase [Streptomyces sp. NBC_01803]|uniref:GNAT family N-acetyltransferase n=1 Tax=Streptomyces sp. NBC_01803 TaxID=2975946 RepID=UPI002DD8A424|nr:GNAT family N-acetyltransferase [Streptomyces sp. NBC_01803]WSA43376.1 N-acetyltransferase [Streptomyces sp. NBC_01803]
MGHRVVDNPERSRFEIFEGVSEGVSEDASEDGNAGGELAGFAEYHLSEGEIAFIHTEIDSRFEGRGLAGALARAALDAARERGLAVLPYCPFIRGWIGKHPEYTELVPAGRRARFGLA